MTNVFFTATGLPVPLVYVCGAKTIVSAATPASADTARMSGVSATTLLRKCGKRPGVAAIDVDTVV
jgi:hypothetical protein